MSAKRINRHVARSSSASYYNIILKLIEACRREPHIDKRIEMLNQINSVLLKSDQLDMESQLTSKHVDIALNKAEGMLFQLQEK
jgi:hypothetical protein